MNRLSSFAAFATPLLAGLAAVAWVGAGYAGSYPLALAVTLVIGAFFLLGTLELHRYRQATQTLAEALATRPDPAPPLSDWLSRIHPALRSAVRLRVEGERAGLPGPALTPYLAGFLVLLGMLGTFVGMVVTLKGTGLALESAADLAAVRASLAAPVKGLGVAFGTSLAGVAASAMLGLMSALARRERLQAGQALDTRIATTLRAYSPAHQREESFRLLQRQTEAMPALVDRLHAMVATLEQQHTSLHERLLAGQDRFHQQAEAAYTGLAASVDRSLKDSLADSARLAGAAIQPAVEATLAGLAREASALHGGVAERVQQQLDGMAQRFEAGTGAVARHWTDALAGQQRANERLASDLRGTLDGFGATFGERSAALVDGVTARLADTTDSLARRWQDQLAQHAGAGQALAAETQRALAATAEQFAQQAVALLHGVQEAQSALQANAATRDERQWAAWTEALAQHERAALALSGDTQQALAATAQQFQQHTATLHDSVAQAHAALQAQAAARDERQLAAWTAALAQHTQTSQAVTAETQQALAGTAAQFAAHAAALQHSVEQSHAALHSQVAAGDAERLAAWTGALAGMAEALRQEWRQAGAEAARQQQDICSTLAETARTVSTEAASQAQGTIAEIGRLLEAAATAPRAAAEVIAELRDKLTDSMARDNAMLDERARVLETLRTLLDAVNHASTEQRAAIDALVGGSAALLERATTQFTERVEADSGRLAEAAARIGAGAAEVASLGEAFGHGVQLFAESNAQLTAHLQHLDDTLARSITRSDEQLAYYVAQAREVIDLSLMSQKQIVDDLQQLARERAGDAA